MKCIHCGTEMKDKSYNYYGFGDWDMDYPASYYEKYYCPNCKCKYEGGDGFYSKSKWKVPKKIELPTEKQVNTILFINNRLSLSLEAITKQQCIRDIGKYFEAAKKTPARCYYDDYDYEEDYYCHCDPYWGNI